VVTGSVEPVAGHPAIVVVLSTGAVVVVVVATVAVVAAVVVEEPPDSAGFPEPLLEHAASRHSAATTNGTERRTRAS
jgi:hypothetical protein